MPESPSAALPSPAVSDPGSGVCLLGTATLRHAGRTVTFTADRPFQLLAGLACHAGWVRRDALAEMLFPERPLEAARGNLRKVIFLARKLDGTDGLESQDDRLRWRPESDASRFERACSEGRLAEATGLYAGPLLDGLDSAWPEPLRCVVVAERQRLRGLWLDAATRQLDVPAEPTAMAQLAQALLRDDPLNDLAVQSLIRAHLTSGQRGAARQVLAAYAARLKDELGLDPAADLQQLAASLDAPGRVVAAGGQAPVAAPTPTPPPTIIGRRLELAQVAERLGDATCRVLTLLGPGGVGKTALARAALARVESAPEPGRRTAWVPLADLRAVDAVPGRIAASLGQSLPAADAPWDAVARQLGLAPHLLVIDNLEHLALASRLKALLEACPSLQLLVTSRAALGIEGEWRLPLGGMPLPDVDESDAEVLLHNDAIQLFEARVKPLVPGFVLAAEASDVARLVHAVEALPLALELLAGWRRLMPVAEILVELQQSLEVLDASAPGDRSVRASFDRSWERLSPAQQSALTGIASIPEPLDRAMARELLQAPLPVLASLMDQSLLRAADDGGWTMHPLIRRCAAARAADSSTLRALHAEHVAGRIAGIGPRTGGASIRLLALAEHALSAWSWAQVQRDVTLLQRLAPSIEAIFEARGQASSGVESMDAALRALEAAPDADVAAVEAARDAIAAARAHLLYLAGQLDAARDAAQALIARNPASEWVQLAAMSALARVHWQRGQLAQAREPAELGMRLAVALGDRPAQARLRRQLALIDKAEGRYADALAGYHEVLELLHDRHDLLDACAVHNNIGNLLRSLGRRDEARAVLRKTLALARQHGLRPLEPFALANLGMVDEDDGRPAAALETLMQAVEVGRRHGEPMILGAALLGRARVGFGAGRPSAEDWRDVHEALAIGRRLQSPSLLAQCVASAGAVQAARGTPQQAAPLLAWGAAQPSLGQAEADAARRRLAELPLERAARDEVLRCWPSSRPLADLLALIPHPPPASGC